MQVQSFEQLLEIVNEEISQLKFPENPGNLYEPVAYTLGLGGKRIRPVLALMACQIFDGNLDACRKAALGMEIFHNFTLLHDDIMDKASLRRGKLTVHAKWNDNVGILSGDAMLTMAYMYIAQVPQDKLPAVLNAFNQTALGVCEGQQYDMDFETATEVSMAEYFEMIRLKTAVLLSGSLEVGALIAGAPKEAVEELKMYGTHIGIAFQLQDDLMDLYANETKFGKKIGSDIRENKKTYLYLKALELLHEEERKILRSFFKVEPMPEHAACTEEERVGMIKALYERINLKAYCVEEIKKYYQLSVQNLENLSKMKVNPEAVTVLKNFTERLLAREH